MALVRILSFIALALFVHSTTHAQDLTVPEEVSESDPETDEGQPQSIVDDDGMIRGEFRSRPLDGVEIEAVESYINPLTNELEVGINFFPFSAFFDGFGASLNYSYHLDETFSWEVIQAAYIFSVQKSLTTDLAENFGVNPVTIESLDYTVATNLNYIFAYGKSVIFKEFIRYFRAGAIGGAGVVGTSSNAKISLNFGLKVSFYISDNYSWNLAFRNHLGVTGGVENFSSFGLGTSYSF